jgi:hypothetical protein
MKSEVRRALREITGNKATGVDELPIELIKAAGEAAITALTALCQQIWKSNLWPQEWRRSLFLPLSKKGDLKLCSIYRNIALIPHTSKILLRIIQGRLATYIKREILEEQAGIRKGRGTRDQIANIRWILEITREYSKTILMCFIDYGKAFNCIDHSRLWNTLRSMGVPEHLIVLIKSLYTNQEAAVKLEYRNTEWFEVRKGVRHRCIMSHYLFNMYSEYILRRVGFEDNIGVQVGGRTINNLQYADDTTILAENKEDMGKLLKKLKEESEKAGLMLNLQKTKIMTTGTPNEFLLDGTEMEIIDCYTFLGPIITRDGYEYKEINRRLSIGRMTMTKLEKIMKDWDVKKATKKVDSKDYYYCYYSLVQGLSINTLSDNEFLENHHSEGNTLWFK